jgi:hypothetical protein
MKTIKSLLGSAQRAEIICAVNNTVVRTLRLVNDELYVFAADGDYVRVPDTTCGIYEPWFMDRGSILFQAPLGTVKLCTEFDRIRLEDGTETTITADDWDTIRPEMSF